MPLFPETAAKREAITTPKPFIKWVGGKQSLAQHLISLFPKNFERYFEPFLGGGSVFFSLNHPHAILSDENQWLIDTYTALKEDWKAVANSLDQMVNSNEEYLKIRSIDPMSLSLHERAAQFIYLNKTCFRGLFRVNRKGKFNVPYGLYQRRYYDPKNLEAVAVALASTEIKSGDYELCLHDITDQDFVYFDPPYYKLGGYSDFNRYTSSQFCEKDHLRLAALCREFDAKGIRWAVSNSDTEFVRRLFSGFHIHSIASRREINLTSKKRDVLELLITNHKKT